MNWAKFTRNAASRKFDELRDADAFQPGSLAPGYPDLRAAILDSLPLFAKSDLEAGAYDIQAGLTLYKVLEACGFGLRHAADDGVWRYLSLLSYRTMCSHGGTNLKRRVSGATVVVSGCAQYGGSSIFRGKVMKLPRMPAYAACRPTTWYRSLNVRGAEASVWNFTGPWSVPPARDPKGREKSGS